MFVQIGHFSVGIDSMNVNTPQYDIGTVDLRNVVAVVKQSQPLTTPEPPAADSAAAAAPITMKLGFEKINLDDININYANDVSAFYTTFAVDQLVLVGKELDLENRKDPF
jgi:hypothetical protein